MAQFSKLLGGRIVETAGQAKNAVAGVAGVEQLRKMTDDAPASVARRADDKDCRTHGEYVARKQTVNTRGAAMSAAGSGSESRKRLE
ncbi:hypothetical protein V502_03368 [Pseudogymnoascus sp. VKM F-4520 (FW-2644)]|nr:hypothetical protein V502_03368 [Pseudogymnoascus sp. VKM F-4520 (FW-2644)]